MGVPNMIKAECHSDDRCVEVTFDATPWFEKATNDEIIELAGCGWGGDYPADEVAEHMACHVDSIADMFIYIRNRNKIETIGFECHVDEEDAMNWLAIHRPELYALITR